MLLRGLTGLSRKFLAQGLSCNCSQGLAGTGIIRRPPLTHISGVWTQMAGTSGNWSGPSMDSLWPPLSMADSEECRASHVATGFPQNMYPKRLGRKLQTSFDLAMGFPSGTSGKKKKKENCLPMQVDLRHAGLIPGSERSPEGRGIVTHSSIQPGKSHGQRSLAGCSPWGHKK